MTAAPSKAALEAAIAVIVRWTASSDRKQCAEIIQTALDEARAEERRAIVEWLRSGAGNFAACGFGPDVAEAIERGDHIKAQEKQE